LRKAAFQDLDHCLVMCADSTMSFVMRKGKPIHPDTVLMRNEILMAISPGKHVH
jgi:HD superfamily phosphohydrolase YqeK